MNSSTGDEPTKLISTIRQYYHKLLRKRRITLLLLSLTVVLAGIFLGGLLEWFFYLSALAKTAIVSTFVLAAIASAVYYARKVQTSSFKSFYHQLSRHYAIPQLKDALDLYYDSAHNQPALHQAAIKQNIDTLETDEIKRKLEDFSTIHPIHRYYRRGSAGLLGILTTLLLFTTWQPSAMNRLAHLGTAYNPPNPYEYTIQPGSITLEQGNSFQPSITFQGAVPGKISLAFKTGIEEEYRNRTLTSSGSNRVSFSPISLTTDGSYYFIMDGFESKKHTISVQLRPRFEQLSLNVIPPDYTRLDTTSFTYPFSQAEAYKGSQIILKGKTNKPVGVLSLFRTASEDSNAQQLTAADSLTFLHRWKVSQTDTIHFKMADRSGLTNKNKYELILEPKKDQLPFVNLIAPSENLKMQQAKEIVLRYEAGDDFGLTSASLHFRLKRAFKNEAEQESISLGRPTMNSEERYRWQLSALDPKPRDLITYWIEVADNDAYNGYKIGRSQKMTITFPSVTEYMDELDSREQEVTETLDNVSESFEEMQREYDQFKKSLKQNPETNWEQKQQLQQVQEKQQKIDERVNELNKKFEEIRKEIEQNQAVSPETMKAYDELQKLMKEIDDPELAEALEKLRNSLGDLNPDQMRKALENYEFNEQQYKERIKRTIELFKSMKLNSDLDKIAKSLDKLAEQERKLRESEQPPKQDIEQQKAIQDDLRKLQEKIQELGEQAPNKAKEQIKKLRQQSLDQMNATKQELQENIKRLQQQQKAPEPDSRIRQQQQQIQDQMQQMAQQMRSAKQQMNQQRAQINARALKYILYSLLNLSTSQEELAKETQNIPSRSQAFVHKARREQNISQQFAMLADSLYQVSSEIPSFSNQINNKKIEVQNQLNRAVEMLSERNKSNATFAQRQSLGGINELASMLATLLDQLQNQQGSGSGGNMTMQQFIEQIQKMSGAQQKINQQIQKMINDIQGERLTRNQMERLNQLSRQQNKIRKQLEKLQQSGQLESGDKVLSELERMSEQMEDTINDLRGGQLDSRMMKRQQNILSRMLSAEKAVQERGKKDQREATTAQEQQQAPPPNVTIEELQKRIRKMLNDPEHTKFSDDYQRLIEQYFELLKKQKKGIINQD